MRRGREALSRGARASMAAVVCLVLANCSSSKYAGNIDPRYGVSSSPRVVGPGEPVPKGGGTYRVGQPYVIGGRTYVPEENPNYRAEGLASWYGDDFHGRLTANGEVYDMHGISAAHPTLPLPCYARVTNLQNGRSLIVRVNDRGPYHNNRLIDLSAKAARLLDFHGNGVARVRVEYVSRAPLEGSDDNILLATLRMNEPAPAPSRILLASARPFLSGFAPRPAAEAGGPVPMPPDRPFTLGESQGSSEAISVPERSASVRSRRIDTARSKPRDGSEPSPMVADESRAPASVAAFLPSRSEVSPSVMTGRGLY
jgi:rare lipoprotein A